MLIPPGFTSGTTTYDLSMADLKKHFAAALNCKEAQLTITPIMRTVSDYMDRDTHQVCDGLKISVKAL